MKLSRSVFTALAVLFMLLFVGAFGLRIWASGQAADLVGPDHVAAGSDRIYLHLRGEILELSPSGDVLSRHPIAKFGLADWPIDLRALADGRLLVAGQQPASLRLCAPPDWHCEALAPGLAPRLRTQFKAAVDESTGRLLVSDTAAGHLWEYPLVPDEGTEPLALRPEKALDMPNDIGIDAAGRIWVADSGNGRLVAFDLVNGRLQEAEALSARNALIRAGRDWPMMLAFSPDGDIWVAQPNPLGTRSDLLVYRPGVGAHARIPLPDPAYATDVAILGTAAIVTDGENFRLYRVDTETQAVTEFGDAGLRADLRRAAAEKAGFETLTQQSLVALVVFAVLMIVTAIPATPKGKRLTPRDVAPPLAASTGPAPELKRIYWLKRDPKNERFLRWMIPMVYVSVGIVLATAAFLHTEIASEAKPEKLDELQNTLFLMLFTVLAMPVLAHLAVKPMRTRLGTDGYRLYVKYPDGLQTSFAPEQLLFSGRQIATGNRVFSISLGNGKPLYVKGEIETFLGPLLARAKRVSPLAMFRHKFSNSEPATVANLIAAVLIAGAMVYTGIWRNVLP